MPYRQKLPTIKQLSQISRQDFIAKLKDRWFNEIKHMLYKIYIRKIYETYAIYYHRYHMYCASLRVAPPRVPGPAGDTDFNWSHGGEAFLFLWFTIVTRDGRFLAPTGYPARQGVQERLKITSRHVSLLRSFIFKRTRIVHSLINCLSHAQLSRIFHARRRRNNQCFRKSCSYDYRVYTWWESR